MLQSAVLEDTNIKKKGFVKFHMSCAAYFKFYMTPEHLSNTTTRAW
jgi:hypothetical protein